MSKGYQPIINRLNPVRPNDEDSVPLDELIAFINAIQVQPLSTHDRTLIKMALDKKSQEIGRLNSKELS